MAAACLLKPAGCMLSKGLWLCVFAGGCRAVCISVCVAVQSFLISMLTLRLHLKCIFRMNV